MKNKISLILVIALGILMPLKTFSQLPFLNKLPDKDERRVKQINRSPAKDHIIFVEKELKSLENDLNSSTWEERRGNFAKEQKDYDAIEQRIKKMEDAIADIKTKDPKWAGKNDYSDGVVKVKTKYDGKLTSYKAWQKDVAESKFIDDKGGEINFYFGDNLKKMYTYKDFQEQMFEGFKYAETKKRIAEIVAARPELKEMFNYKRLAKLFEIEFPDFAAKGLPKFIEEKRKEAAEEFEHKPDASIKTLNNLIGYCKGMQLLSPEIDFYKNTLPKLEELGKKFGKYLDEKVYTGEFHKKNAGQVFLSNKPVIPGKENEADFKNVFNVGESIYGVYYYREANFPSNTFLLYVNNDICKGFFKAGKMDAKEERSTTAFTFQVIPDPALHVKTTQKGVNDYEGYHIADKILNSIESAGEFADKIFSAKLMLGSAGSTQSSVTFTINANQGAEPLRKICNELKKQRADNLRFPKGGYSNSEIVSACTSALKSMGLTPLRVMSAEPAWTLNKNKYNNVVFSRSAYCYTVVKNKNGKCYLYLVYVRQEKAGSIFGKPEIYDVNIYYSNVDGNYYDSRLDGMEIENMGMEGFEMNCSNINK